MDVKRLVLNGDSYFGANAKEMVATAFEDHHFKKALVVTDDNLLNTGVSSLVLDVLNHHFIPYDIFSDVQENPTVESVKKGVEKGKETEADCIIAIGGGSVISTAKAIGIILTNPEFSDVTSLEGKASSKYESLPIIAVSTTIGTSSETSMYYMITDLEHVKKMVCIDVHAVPVVSIVDSDLLSKMPSNLLATTGMDALAHAIEGYISKDAWLLPDLFLLDAIRLISQNINEAVTNHNEEAIMQMGMAQHLSGMGFSNTGLGIVHSMAHALGALYNTSHGVASALLLPYVLYYNLQACPDKATQIAHALGIELANASLKEVVQKIADYVFYLNKQFGIPTRLKEISVLEEDLPKLSEMAFQDICTQTNPIDVTPKILLNLFKNAF